jgi:hypothetical protein
MNGVNQRDYRQNGGGARYAADAPGFSLFRRAARYGGEFREAVGRTTERTDDIAPFCNWMDLLAGNTDSGAPIFQNGFRPLGSETKLAKAHAEGDSQ